MGSNCFKSTSNPDDDISLLRGLDPSGSSGGANGGDSNPMGANDDYDLSPPPYERRIGVLHPGMDLSQAIFHLSEEEQVKIAKRIGLINHLPCVVYDSNKKARECAICMGEFLVGDKVRFLPCMHTYHCECIDDWLMRSLTCPSCMEPVDAALLTTYDVSSY